MATFLPPPQPASSRPLTDFPPNSPPDQSIFYSSDISQSRPSVQTSNGNRLHHQASTELPPNGQGSSVNSFGAMPVHNDLQRNGGSRHRGSASMGAFEGARSPPNTKNTSHVPCKFFRSGQCQAGKACPFSHSMDISTVDTPCKYFAKGNCKFGAKCALAHILPNGRRVNRPNLPPGGQLNFGGRADPHVYQPSDSALTHSLLTQHATTLPFDHQIPLYSETDYLPLSNVYENFSLMDNGYTPHTDPKYTSPRDENRNPISPIPHLSVLDAPLPASFDSQGISHMARYGAVAASVPSKFGLESPSASLPKKSAIPNDAVRNLHSSAFGKEQRGRGPDLGSSPLGSGDEGFTQRIMHSRRVNKPAMMSASLPRERGFSSEDWDDGMLFGGEEDFLPSSLHDDVLTPQEKMRRLSRSDQDSRNMRDSLSGIGTPAEPSSKVGSPHTGSPSRYGALFARQKQEETAYTPSAFGHVGSPLRNSSLHPFASPTLRASRISGDVSPAFASPPRQSSMSMISQQLARARISSQTSESNADGTLSNGINGNSTASHPSSTRHPSSASNLNNRAVSSSSISGTGRIEEEQDGVFSMEEEEEDHRKRYSGNNWSMYSSAKPDTKANGTGRGRGTEEKPFWNAAI